MDNNSPADKLTEISHELMAIANDALLYTKDGFDVQRFKRVRQIAADILAISADKITPEDAQALFEENEGYQTPKIDTRAAVFNEKEEVLLVRDYDGKWAMPGGWCEYNLTIMENTVKEAKEEAGLNVEPVKLVAAHSNRWHNNPKSYFYITRFFVLCRNLGGGFEANEETSEARYFDVDALPGDLNDHKCSPEQIRLCKKALHEDHWVPRID
ncbi:MAG: NUDIX hydrolase N-terminal domain-containing protein [Saccharofermentans sp.]|nr:NUDIX hydrolase N-terminal domain-containing protein [Saccharofermentans sp.]